MAIQIGWLIVFLTNRTEPSPIRTLIPPGWRLRAPAKAFASPEVLGSEALGKQGRPRTGSGVQNKVTALFSQSPPLFRLKKSLNPLGVNRVMNDAPPGMLDQSRPRMSYCAPWSTSPRKTVLLVPSVTLAML